MFALEENLAFRKIVYGRIRNDGRFMDFSRDSDFRCFSGGLLSDYRLKFMLKLVPEMLKPVPYSL